MSLSSSEKIAVITVLCLTFLMRVITANDQFKQEGENADLKFSYRTVAPVEYVLRNGHDDPFFKKGQVIADNLTPSQQKRFLVNARHSLSDKLMLVHMKVTGVERTDAGNYICEFINDGEVIISSTQTVSLSVDFPPRPVECRVLPQTEYEELDKLQCAAIGGSPQGEISCFQNDQKTRTVAKDLSVNNTHISQSFWIDPKLPVFCCSHNGTNVKRMHCNDFVKLLPTNVALQTSQSPSKPILKQTFPYGSNDLYKADEGKKAFTLNVVILVVVIVLTVLVMLLVILVYREFYHSKEHDSNSYKVVNTNNIDDIKTEDNTSQETTFVFDDLKNYTPIENVPLEEMPKDPNNSKGKSLEKENERDAPPKITPRDPPVTADHDPKVIREFTHKKP